jgi:hypothetical protein
MVQTVDSGQSPGRSRVGVAHPLAGLTLVVVQRGDSVVNEVQGVREIIDLVGLGDVPDEVFPALDQVLEGLRVLVRR